MAALPHDKSLTTNKQIKNNPKRKTQNHQHHNHNLHHHHTPPQVSQNISRQASGVEMEMMMMHGHAFHRSISLLPSPILHPPPPLLPLPTATKPPLLSLPPPTRHHHHRHSLSPPSKNTTTPTKAANKKHKTTTTKSPARKSQNGVVELPTKKVGPDPGRISKEDLTRVLKADINRINVGYNEKAENDELLILSSMEKFCGTVFSLSPPPSSLPLPTFSLRRPKLSCTVEAATGEIVDECATDNLCQVLKLR